MTTVEGAGSNQGFQEIAFVKEARRLEKGQLVKILTKSKEALKKEAGTAEEISNSSVLNSIYERGNSPTEKNKVFSDALKELKEMISKEPVAEEKTAKIAQNTTSVFEPSPPQLGSTDELYGKFAQGLKGKMNFPRVKELLNEANPLLPKGVNTPEDIAERLFFTKNSISKYGKITKDQLKLIRIFSDLNQIANTPLSYFEKPPAVEVPSNISPAEKKEVTDIKEKTNKFFSGLKFIAKPFQAIINKCREGINKAFSPRAQKEIADKTIKELTTESHKPGIPSETKNIISSAINFLKGLFFSEKTSHIINEADIPEYFKPTYEPIAVDLNLDTPLPPESVPLPAPDKKEEEFLKEKPVTRKDFKNQPLPPPPTVRQGFVQKFLKKN